MKKLSLAATGLVLGASAATAGGLDRSYTPVDLIFEKGSYAELSYGFTMPDLTGSDFLGNAIGNVGSDYGIWGAGLKLQFNEQWSFSLIFDQPYGADTSYAGNPATSLLAGTGATADSNALTAILKYQATDRFSVYGGPRVVRADGTISLSGLAYGPLSGYQVNFNSNDGLGYVLGAAYERPELGMRISATYHSAVDLDFQTAENIPTTAGGLGFYVPTGITATQTPQSFELAAQTGLNPRTLLFGSVRWSEWSAFSLNPPSPVPNLAELDDTWTYEIGVGRRFTDKFSGSVAFSYEPGGSDSLVSPLAPTNGQTAVTVGGKYQVTDRISFSGGLRYTMLGNALPETGTPDTPRGSFRNNDALSVGFKIGIALN
ncbi:MAG: outer membrane protein transport protein [Roseovarius sp.]